MSQTLFDDDLARGDLVTAEDGYAFIGAVHTLVSAKRAATNADLILAAACQALRKGDKTAGALRS